MNNPNECPHDWQDATEDIPEEQVGSGKYCPLCRITSYK
jgi:hypothetical protein